MAENKKRKRQKKRKKPYPPLSKTDKAIYIIFQLTSALFLLGTVLGYMLLAGNFIFRNPDVLAYSERWTPLLILPFFMLGSALVFDINRKKTPLFGNKKVDYYNTNHHRFALPLFDKRYQQLESCKKAKKAFIKKASIWSVVLIILFCIGLLGYMGRHEFDDNGITTYSVFNNPIKEYSYDEVEAYELRAAKHYRTDGRYSSSVSYEVFIKLNLESGKEFFVNYDFCRDIYAMKELANRLEGKPKIVDDSYLEEFIERRDLTEDEIKALYELFEK